MLCPTVPYLNRPPERIYSDANKGFCFDGYVLIYKCLYF